MKQWDVYRKVRSAECRRLSYAAMESRRAASSSLFERFIKSFELFIIASLHPTVIVDDRSRWIRKTLGRCAACSRYLWNF